jgi:hypothetical protein
MKSYKSNFLSGISASAFLFLTLASAALAQGPLYTFRAEGNFASVSRFERTATGYRAVFVSVNSGGTAENPLTFLFFERIELSSGGVYTREYGTGLIPNSAFTADPQSQHLALSIDVNTVPDFRFYRLVITSGCQSPTPGTPPEDGLIALSWDKTPERWYRSEGHSVTQIYELVLHSQGTSASFSAAGQGTVFGQDIGGVSSYANIGVNHNVYMAVEHGQ